jgi:peptidoglycan/LPS O-acetylase OafA/YrhL
MANPGTEITLYKAFHAKVLPGVDAMRAAAVIMVVLYHQDYISPGWLGVTLFFVLSGFLITRLLLEEVAKSGTISLRTFYKRRSMRIFPAFYLCWAVTTVVMLLTHEPIVWKQAAESFFYLADYGRAFLPVDQPPAFHMGISWSLAIEEQFYLLWPLGLLWIIKARKQPATAVAICIAVIWVWRVILMFGFHVGWEYVYNAFDTRADELLIGCWLAIALNGKQLSSIPLVLLKSRWMVLATLLALTASVWLDNRIDRFPLQHVGLRLTTFTLEPVLSGLLLLQLVFWGSVGWKFLENRVVKLIARLSYSIYLYHPLILDFTVKIPIQHHIHRMVGDPFILAAAALSYYLVERPIMKMRDRGRVKSVLLDDGLKHEP